MLLSDLMGETPDGSCPTCLVTCLHQRLPHLLDGLVIEVTQILQPRDQDALLVPALRPEPRLPARRDFPDFAGNLIHGIPPPTMSAFNRSTSRLRPADVLKSSRTSTVAATTVFPLVASSTNSRQNALAMSAVCG